MASSIFLRSLTGCSGTTRPELESVTPTRSRGVRCSTTALAAPRITASALGLSMDSSTRTTATGGLRVRLEICMSMGSAASTGVPAKPPGPNVSGPPKAESPTPRSRTAACSASIFCCSRLAAGTSTSATAW